MVKVGNYFEINKLSCLATLSQKPFEKSAVFVTFGQTQERKKMFLPNYSKTGRTGCLRRAFASLN